MQGFQHHDPVIDGWRFGNPLPYGDGLVECITISHGMSQASAPDEWKNLCNEFFRVLKPDGGVVRITDDDTESPASPRRHKPYPNVKSLTGPRMARHYLTEAGFVVNDVGPYYTSYKDTSILIHLRIAIPNYVFYIEGIKP